MIKKVTIQDIAKELDLSRNTVAKALGNSETVAYDTRMTIIKKAWEMGYQKMSPSILEEYKLVDKGSDVRTIVVLAKREVSIFWNSIIVGISDELNRCNCRMRLDFISNEDEHNLVLPRDFQEDVHGVILMSVFDPRFTDVILKKGLPTVFLDFPIGSYALSCNCDVVLVEGKKSVKEVTDTLIGQGLTRIGFIGDVSYCESFKERYEGYCEALSGAGLVPDPKYVVNTHLLEHYSDTEVEHIIDMMGSLPEAIVCANDDIALKVIRAFKKKDIAVPQDVAVTGFDNEEELAHADPILTTVSVKNQLLGERLVQELLWRTAHPDCPRETVLIGSEIIYRTSSNKYKY